MFVELNKTKIKATPEVLKIFPLKEKWKEVKGLKEDTEFSSWSWNINGWGRVINNKHVLVLINHCGEYHGKWRMYVDGEMVYCMDHIPLMMGSGKNAMLEAEAYMNSSNLRLKIKLLNSFDQKMDEVLQKSKIGV